MCFLDIKDSFGAVHANPHGDAMFFLDIALHAQQDISAHGQIGAGAWPFTMGHGEATAFNWLASIVNRHSATFWGGARGVQIVLVEVVTLKGTPQT